MPTCKSLRTRHDTLGPQDQVSPDYSASAKRIGQADRREARHAPWYDQPDQLALDSATRTRPHCANREIPSAACGNMDLVAFELADGKFYFFGIDPEACKSIFLQRTWRGLGLARHLWWTELVFAPPPRWGIERAKKELVLAASGVP